MSADNMDYDDCSPEYHFDAVIYEKTVYNGFGKPKKDAKLTFGPNITDWPEMIALDENILLEVCSVIPDPVTTTDELIPSGDTSSYRSNPIRMSDFTLMRRDPAYVGRAKKCRSMELARQSEQRSGEMARILSALLENGVIADAEGFWDHTEIGSVICANRPGDGSAREQAASCQRVLGGLANICVEYATKRYRSNLVNWGMIPFTWTEGLTERLAVGDFVYVPGVRKAVLSCAEEVDAYILKPDGSAEAIVLYLKALSKDEAEIVAAGSLINYYSC